MRVNEVVPPNTFRRTQRRVVNFYNKVIAGHMYPELTRRY